jgi:hypothetical protein
MVLWSKKIKPFMSSERAKPEAHLRRSRGVRIMALPASQPDVEDLPEGAKNF